MWLWLSTALALDAGVIRLTASPEADVVVFPRVDARRIDLGIYDNRVPLDEQLDGFGTRYLDAAWATSIGGGTWFVTLHVDEGIDLSVVRTADHVRLRLAPGQGEVVPTPAAPSLATLLDAPPPRRPDEPVPLTLHPMRGDASTLLIDPIDAFRFMPKVVTPHVATYRSSLAAIDTYREVLIGTDQGEVRAAALARIGVAMSNLDLHRDALYYLEQALEGGRDDAPVALMAARSHVALGQTEEALSLCRYAARRSAREQDVLACLAGVALLDADLPASELGRALARSSAHPHRRLMAAQLLAADHRHHEAQEILEGLLEFGGPEVFAAYGDALQSTGDLPGALDAWRAAARSRELQPRMTLRMRMAEWVLEGPSSFPRAIPELLAISDGAGLVAAEAHYLLAQIAQVYGDADIAAEQLNLLWNHHPGLAMRSDVPERLVATCTFRLRQLGAQERHVDLVAFYELCWRDELDAMVVEPGPLQAASRSLAHLGLTDDALAEQLRAMAMLSRVDREDPGALAWLAELYQRTERHREALETVRFVRQLDEVAPALDEPLALVEGDALMALGQADEAMAAWKKAASPRADRRRGLHLAEQGDCDGALALLRSLDGDDVSLAVARCLLRAGDVGGAAERLGRVDDDDAPAREDADWLASLAAIEGAETKPSGVWERLLAEEAASEAWRASRGVE